MIQKNYIWHKIREGFRTEIPKSEFQTWLARASLREINAHHAVIEVPNKFIARWLQENYTDQIQSVIRENLNTLPEIHFTFGIGLDSPKGVVEKPLADPSARSYRTIDSLMTFADFVTATSNRLAYSSALNVAEKPGTTYNPLYIFSKPGLGKTHLLNAIGNLVLANKACQGVMYISAERSVKKFSLAAQTQAGPRFRQSDGQPDFLIVDDIHLLAGHWKSQTDLLALYRTLLESAKQVVVSADSPPGNIPDLLPELRSRLEWGLIAEIGPPGQRTKLKIIKKRAKKERLILPEDVAFYLANTTDDLGTLVRHLHAIKVYVSSHRNTAIDISAIESIMQKNGRPASFVDIRHIQKVTAKYFNISRTHLLSSNRERACSYPRQIAIYLSKKLTSLSLKEIGLAFGNRHHSTVIYATNRIRKAMTKSKSVSRDLQKIESLLF